MFILTVSASFEDDNVFSYQFLIYLKRELAKFKLFIQKTKFLYYLFNSFMNYFMNYISHFNFLLFIYFYLLLFFLILFTLFNFLIILFTLFSSIINWNKKFFSEIT